MSNAEPPQDFFLGEPSPVAFQCDQKRRASTKAMLSFLALGLSWELEIAAAILHIFTPARVDLVTHAILLSLSILFTCLWLATGRIDSGGYRSEVSLSLSGPQMLLVTVFIIAIGGVAGHVAFRVING